MTISKEVEVFVGKYSDYEQEISDLVHEHWKEVGMPGTKDLDLNINTNVYKHMETLNKHLGIGLRIEHKLIGYISIFIYDHHQHCNSRFAQTDGFFVNPKYRGIKSFRAICKAFQLAESILKDKYGVEYFMITCNASNNLQILADKLGFTESAISYTKSLKE